MKNPEFFKNKPDNSKYFIYPISMLENLETTGKKPAGYVEAIKAASAAYNEKFVAVTKDDFALLKTKFSPTVSQQIKNVANSAVNAAKSLIKTQIFNVKRVPDAVYESRLNTCKNCPSNACQFKNGKPWTCGKMADSITGKSPTCGCVLTAKVRDADESCPLGHWDKEKVN